MENSFDNRDFERFVRQNADQYRMFPSEKVWKGVHNALHTRRRWYGIGLALLLITTAAVTVVMLVPSGKNNSLAANSRNINNLVANKPAEKTAPDVQPVIGPVQPADDRNGNGTYPVTLPVKFTRNNNNVTETAEKDPADHPAAITNLPEPVITTEAISQVNAADKNTNTRYKPVTFINKNNPETNSILTEPKLRQNDPIIAALTDNAVKKTEPVSEKPDNKKDGIAPYTIESVVNSYRHTGKSRKWGWELFLTPTISYRKLSENTEFISAARYNSIINGNYGITPIFYTTDVNSVVNHKPDLGFQLGVRGAYPISKWFSLTAGLQLGVSKYDIKASSHSSEVATISLTTARSGSNTVSTVTNYRTADGYKENWLRNFYFSASLPLGMELKLSDGNKNYFGIGGTLQPTYVLDNRAYLISTDYKNYAEVPSLIRHWNLNTSFEIFSAHTTGKVQWRVGPQVHYQLMSSFVKNYPIKEHLFDFGLKLGVMLR